MHETHELAVMCDTFHPLQADAVRARPRRRPLRVLLVHNAQDGGTDDGDASGAGLTSHL